MNSIPNETEVMCLICKDTFLGDRSVLKIYASGKLQRNRKRYRTCMVKREIISIGQINGLNTSYLINRKTNSLGQVLEESLHHSTISTSQSRIPVPQLQRVKNKHQPIN